MQQLRGSKATRTLLVIEMGLKIHPLEKNATVSSNSIFFGKCAAPDVLYLKYLSAVLSDILCLITWNLQSRSVAHTNADYFLADVYKYVLARFRPVSSQKDT